MKKNTYRNLLTLDDFKSNNPSYSDSAVEFIYNLENCPPEYWELLKNLNYDVYNAKRINTVINTIQRKYGRLIKNMRSLPDATFDSSICNRIEYCIAHSTVESFFYEFYRFYFKKYNIESLISFAYTLPEDEKEVCKQLIYMSLEFYKGEKEGANINWNQFSSEANYSYDRQPNKTRVLTISELQPQPSFLDLFFYMAYNHKSFRNDRDRVAYLTSKHKAATLRKFINQNTIRFNKYDEEKLYNEIGHVNLDNKQEHLKDLIQEAIDTRLDKNKKASNTETKSSKDDMLNMYIYKGKISSERKGMKIDSRFDQLTSTASLSKIYKKTRKLELWKNDQKLLSFLRSYFSDEALKRLLDEHLLLTEQQIEKIKMFPGFVSFLDDEKRIKNIISKILHIPAPVVTVDPQVVNVEEKISKEIAYKEGVALDAIMDNTIESSEPEKKKIEIEENKENEQVIPSKELESNTDEPLDGTMQSDIADINEATVLVDEVDNTNNQDHTNILPVSNETNEEPTSAENSSTIDEDVTNEKTVEETIQLSDIVEVVYTENETPAKTTEQTVGTQKETEINYEEVELSAAAGNKERKQRKKSIRTAVDHEQVHVESKESGSKGEELVVEYEKERLRKLKMSEEQINSVRMVSKLSDDYGFDIMSLDKDGAPLYIEVKSTKRKAGNTDFFYSENEMQTAKELGDSYKVYLVFDVYGKNPVIRNIGNPTMKRQSVKIRPVNYKVSVKFKK